MTNPSTIVHGAAARRAVLAGLCAVAAWLSACGGGATPDPTAGTNSEDTRGATALAASVKTPVPQEASVAQAWLRCATEGGVCNFSGVRPVRYGTANTFVLRWIAGPVPCTNQVFGDPIAGVVKGCWVGNPTREDPPAPPPPAGPALYFSDCQTGAQPGCIAGSNANPGTQAAPKQTLSGIDVNTLAAGTRLLFAQGGAWNNVNLQLRNLNVTTEQPLTFDSYATAWGQSVRPWIRAGGSFYAFQFGTYGDTENDGGYVVRNLRLDGVDGATAWGFHLRNNVHHVLLENLEIHGFEIGIHSGGGVSALTVRNNLVHMNAEMGMLGYADDLVVEGNTFRFNNFSGSPFNHGVYLSGGARNGLVRNNTFAGNSTVNGVCSGGNLTVHGQWDGLVVEGNTITQTASNGGCYGISINSAYDTAEYFRRLVVRGNVLHNVGGCSICLTSAPGALVENNLIVNTQAAYQAAILIPDRTPGPGDDVDGGAIIRNNTIYLTQPGASSEGIALRPGSGGGVQVTSNLIAFGPATGAQSRCFSHSARSAYTSFDHNLCHFASGNGSWSAAYPTLTAARAAGFDANGLNVDPLLIELPSSSNGWNDLLRAGSPAIDTGHPTLSSPYDRLGMPRAVPNIGARE